MLPTALLFYSVYQCAISTEVLQGEMYLEFHYPSQAHSRYDFVSSKRQLHFHHAHFPAREPNQVHHLLSSCQSFSILQSTEILPRSHCIKEPQQVFSL